MIIKKFIKNIKQFISELNSIHIFLLSLPILFTAFIFGLMFYFSSTVESRSEVCVKRAKLLESEYAIIEGRCFIKDWAEHQ